MKNRNIIFTTVLLVLGCFALLPVVAAPGTSNVNVVNTPSVNVANTPSVLLSGTPIVGLDANNNTVREADNPARHAYQDITVLYIIDGQAAMTGFFRQVPDGKRLVIEFISVKALVPSTQTLEQVAIRVRNYSDQLPNYQIDVNAKGQDPFALPASDLFVGSKQVRLYADPGSTPSCYVTRDAFAGTASIEVDISGYLVDLP